MEDTINRILRNDNVENALIKLSIPAIIGMLITATYNIIDTFFIGILGITSATAAVSIVFPLFLLIGALGLALGIGGGTYISRMLGSQQKDSADIAGSITIFTVLGLSSLFTIPGVLFMEPILKALGASPTIMPYACAYARILISGTLFTMGNMAMDNLVRAEGNAKHSMMVIIAGTVLNVILDPIFIFTFDLGVKGAAFATVLSQAVSFFLFLHYYFSGKSFVKVSIKLYTFSAKLFIEIFQIGVPVFIKQFLISMSAGLVNIAAASYGDFAVAAMGITMRVTSIVIMVIIGFTQGFQPLAAYSYGAKKIDRLNQAIKVSILWLTGFTVISAILISILAKYIVSLFSDDIRLINTGVELFRAFSITLPLLGFIFIYGSLFEALGKGGKAFFQSLSRQGIFFIPPLFILPMFFGLNGVIWSQPLADLITVFLTIILAGNLKKELHCIQCDKDAHCYDKNHYSLH
ncbi:MATE family efflux transporter [Petroclostridium sp. X23]|uniref:MATE family efflux transporter n=1 Tax=Petroclostridium sp. X23 TaxID=3045146 RepID=UPI0024AD0DD2|nr:MATE family efflux transporter [Petroclostridium sp. X23]WHH58853.1 MATE family efflux transporter [Petroclostridium sp. X23]